MKINYVIGAFLCVLGCYGCSSPKTEVKSPDGHIKMALTVDDNGKPLYNILVGDSLLIENSTLGFTEKNGIDLGGFLSPDARKKVSLHINNLNYGKDTIG